jgi:hypothetical protein
MERYLVFGGHDAWDPYGGWKDFIKDFSSLEDAIADANFLNVDEYYFEWADVVDLETGKICWSSGTDRKHIPNVIITRGS